MKAEFILETTPELFIARVSGYSRERLQLGNSFPTEHGNTYFLGEPDADPDYPKSLDHRRWIIPASFLVTRTREVCSHDGITFDANVLSESPNRIEVIAECAGNVPFLGFFKELLAQIAIWWPEAKQAISERVSPDDTIQEGGGCGEAKTLSIQPWMCLKGETLQKVAKRYLEGLTEGEIGKLLSMTPGTIKARIHDIRVQAPGLLPYRRLPKTREN